MAEELLNDGQGRSALGR